MATEHDDLDDDDTTVYLIGAGDEPQWYAATDSPEEAVAEAISGIGVDPSAEYLDPFRVSKISAGALAEYEPSVDGFRQAEAEAEELRTYDHEEALRRAEEIDASVADDRIEALGKKIYG